MESGKQLIKCNVEDCKYNSDQRECNLDTIQVSHDHSHQTAGNTSTCASFEE